MKRAPRPASARTGVWHRPQPELSGGLERAYLLRVLDLDLVALGERQIQREKIAAPSVVNDPHERLPDRRDGNRALARAPKLIEHRKRILLADVLRPSMPEPRLDVA